MHPVAYDEGTKSCTARHHITLFRRDRSICVNSEAVQYDGHADLEKRGM
jgi:hypothetical protein